MLLPALRRAAVEDDEADRRSAGSATLVFVATAYSHHLYMDFVQPGWRRYVSQIASSAAALPVAVVTIYTGMMLVWGSRYRWTLASTLLYLGFAGWAIGGTGAVLDSLIPVNFRLHNTLWVPAHFHTYLMHGRDVLGAWRSSRTCSSAPPDGRRSRARHGLRARR